MRDAWFFFLSLNAAHNLALNVFELISSWRQLYGMACLIRGFFH